MNGYTTIPGQDQNGQTISQYTNNQQKCKSECDSNPKCKGMVTNANNCWTIKGFSSQYSKSGSTIYKKIVYPIPAMSSNNFPTSSNNNLFSSVFCKNISTNNSFIQKENSTFNNLPVYKTQSTPDENTCLNNCKNDAYCSSYSFQKNNSSSNCSLYNQVPTSIANNNNINSGYKNTYKYDFNNLNSNQKNVIRNDCINNYLNNNYDTNNLNYTSYYSLGNNNSQINFNAGSLANLYAPLGKVNNKNIFTNIDNNLIYPTTNQELNNFSNNYNGYFQTLIGTIHSSNGNNINSDYNEEINNTTNIQSDNAKNNLLEAQNENTDLINQSINGTENNNIIENFGNNNESNNNDKSKTIKFYLFIFIVIIFLYIVYYLKKNKHFK